MAFFYQIFIHLFNFCIHIASFFNKKARLFVVGRKNIFEKIGQAISHEVVWFHCSSLGEFEQARPLMEKLKIENGKLKILITFFSPSGYEVRKKYEGADFVFYLPVDTRSNVKKFLNIVNPSLVFFVKYDLWYNYLHELNKRKTPTYLVSANFRQEQFSGMYGKYLRKVLSFFTGIFVQNESSTKILTEQNIQNITVSGDLRYDKVSQTVLSAKKNQVVEMFTSSPALLPREKGEKAKIMVCGSSWEQDEKIIEKWKMENGKWKMIIAPHEINEEHINSLIRTFADRHILRYSQISKEPVSTALDKLNAANVLVIDNIGMLSNLYQYADIAYIGGGFGSGIHNILEAVAFGVPVIFGPNHHKFPEANEIIEQGGGFSISSAEDFQKVMELLLSDEKILKMASMTCKNFVQGRKGATEKILGLVSAVG